MAIKPRAVTLPKLRFENPDWHWRAERSGMGWQYHGIHKTARDASGMARMATVYEVGLVGRFEDESPSEWRVEDNGRAYSETYGYWWLSQESKESA